MTAFLINTSPTAKDINQVLQQVWGGDTPISRVPGFKGNTFGVTAEDRGSPVSCAVMYAGEDQILELGSVAIISKYRGCGLLRSMTESLSEKTTALIKRGHKIHTYGTIGSKVLYVLTKIIGNWSGQDCRPLNMATGIVPVDLDKAKVNLEKEALIIRGTKNLNSTMEIGQIPEKIYGQIGVFPELEDYLKQFVLMEKGLVKQYGFKASLPIYLDIYQPKSPESGQFMSEIEIQDKTRVLKILVPMDRKYRKIVDRIRSDKYYFAGISFDNGFVYLNFLANFPAETPLITGFIARHACPQIAEFGMMLEQVNRTLGTGKSKE